MLKGEVVSDASLSYSSGSSPELPSMLEERPESNALQQINGSVMPTTCAICGEACSCYHYNVPSCNSCKTFFRRNVLSNRKMVCKANGRCDIIQGSEVIENTFMTSAWLR
ncbi:zinc finger protein [Aphelenchoides avenae]|nr:zinc finger protein [Aphelenchus avenae]